MKKLDTLKEFNTGCTNEAGPIGDKGVTGITEAESTKGTDLAKTTVANLRKKFKKLSNQELDDFMTELAYSFDLIKKH